MISLFTVANWYLHKGQRSLSTRIHKRKHGKDRTWNGTLRRYILRRWYLVTDISWLDGVISRTIWSLGVDHRTNTWRSFFFKNDESSHSYSIGKKVKNPTKVGSGKNQSSQAVFRDHDDSVNEEAWFMSWELREWKASITSLLYFLILYFLIVTLVSET